MKEEKTIGERVHEIFEEVYDNVSPGGIIPSEEDNVDYSNVNKVLENALENEFCGEEYIAYLTATNPYKNVEDIKEVRDKVFLKAREVLMEELDDPERIDKRILSGLSS